MVDGNANDTDLAEDRDSVRANQSMAAGPTNQ